MEVSVAYDVRLCFRALYIGMEDGGRAESRA